MEVHSLSKETAEKILSGQIIVDLINILKELIENSLDSGATTIKVVCSNFGTEFVEVSDDGSGISMEDLAKLCRFGGTSKIEEYEDLNRIKTFGFRGEGLAGIRHYSDVEVYSKTRNAAQGYKALYTLENREPIVHPASVPEGAQIRVIKPFLRDRIKRETLLQHCRSQFRYLVEYVQTYSLFLPAVKFEFYHISDEKYQCVFNYARADNIWTRIKELYGPAMVSQMDMTQVSEPPVKMVAYCSKEQSSGSQRNNAIKRTEFKLFVNDKPAAPLKFLKAAVEKAYTEFNRQAKFLVLLMVELPKEWVDFNASKDKRELLLKNQDMLKRIAYNLIKNFLNAVKEDAKQLSSAQYGMPKAGLKEEYNEAGYNHYAGDQSYQGSGGYSQMTIPHQDNVPFVVPAIPSPIVQRNLLSPRAQASQHQHHPSLEQSLPSFSNNGVPSYRASELPGQSRPNDNIEFTLKNRSKAVYLGPVAAKPNAPGANATVLHTGPSQGAVPMNRLNENPKDNLPRRSGNAVRRDIDLIVNESPKPSSRGFGGPPPADMARSMGPSDSKDMGFTNKDFQDFFQPRCADNCGPAEKDQGRVRINPETRTQVASITNPAPNASSSRMRQNTSEKNPLVTSLVGRINATDLKKRNDKLRQSDFEDLKVIGQFNRGFIICKWKEFDGRYFVVDQHAANEKYNYEKLVDEVKLKTQILISPIKVPLNCLDYIKVEENLSVFISNGFVLDLEKNEQTNYFGVTIKGAPNLFSKQYEKADFMELLYLISNHGDYIDELVVPKIKKDIASKACKSSIKIGDALTVGTMKEVLDNLSRLKNPWACPHGRPTAIIADRVRESKLDREDIQKKVSFWLA